MRTAATAGRLRLLLAVLLALLGTSAATPGTGPGPAGARPASLIALISESTSATPPIQDDPRDPLRLTATAPHTSSTALPETWWALHPGTTGECTPLRGSAIGAVATTGTAATAATPRSSRAPPTA